MLKILVVFLPMVASATLASAAPAAIDFNAKPVAVTARSMQTVHTSRLPKQASWAIMLIGLGVVGGAARKRRAHHVA